MASRKNKAGKHQKKPQAPSRKPRLWLRDLLNLVGGALVGALVLWLVLEYQESRAAKAAARIYAEAVSETVGQLRPLADQYLELTQGRDEGEALAEAEVDAARPVGSLEPFRNVFRDACALPPDIVPPLLEFARNLHKAEMLRKLLEQQQEDPEAMSRTLAGQLLQTVYEESRNAQPLLWKLKERAGKMPEKAAPPDAKEQQ